MAIDAGLMAVAPDQPEGVVPDRLNVFELEIPAFDVPYGPFVTLALRARAEAPKELVRVYTPMTVRPVDFHDASPSRRPQLHGLGSITHVSLPSQRRRPVEVRSRTPTVA